MNRDALAEKYDRAYYETLDSKRPFKSEEHIGVNTAISDKKETTYGDIKELSYFKFSLLRKKHEQRYIKFLKKHNINIYEFLILGLVSYQMGGEFYKFEKVYPMDKATRRIYLLKLCQKKLLNNIQKRDLYEITDEGSNILKELLKEAYLADKELVHEISRTIG